MPFLSFVVVNLPVIFGMLPGQLFYEMNSGAPILNWPGQIVGILHGPKTWVSQGVRSMSVLYLGLLTFSFGFCPQPIKKYADEVEYAIAHKDAWSERMDKRILETIEKNYREETARITEMEKMRLYYRVKSANVAPIRYLVLLLYAAGALLILQPVVERSIAAGATAYRLAFNPTTFRAFPVRPE